MTIPETIARLELLLAKANPRNPGPVDATLLVETCEYLPALLAALKDRERLLTALQPFAEAERAWMNGGPQQRIAMDDLTRAREAYDAARGAQ